MHLVQSEAQHCVLTHKQLMIWCFQSLKLAWFTCSVQATSPKLVMRTEFINQLLSIKKSSYSFWQKYHVILILLFILFNNFSY